MAHDADGRRRPVRRGQTLVSVSSPGGDVVGGNTHARDEFGCPDGAPCWKRMGSLENAEGLPCSEGCSPFLSFL